MSRNTEPLYVLYVSEIHAFGNRPIYFDSVVEKFVATLRFLLLLLGKIESNSHQQMYCFVEVYAFERRA